MDTKLSIKNDLADKIAIITGAARGIGRATVNTLAMHGATVIVSDMREDLSAEVADELNRSGLKAISRTVNVADENSVHALMSFVYEKFGHIDILVNCAGILDMNNIETMSSEVWDRVIDIDLRGTHFCCQAAVKYMTGQGSGKIVNIASTAGQRGGLYSSVSYTAAKGGILSLTKGYALQCAKHGINVNCISPGLIATDMTQGRGDDPNTVPLGRIGSADDCANAIYFLCSDLSNYITGSCIDVNGGELMR